MTMGEWWLSLYNLGTSCGLTKFKSHHRAHSSAFQAVDVGWIPITRSNHLFPLSILVDECTRKLPPELRDSAIRSATEALDQRAAELRRARGPRKGTGDDAVSPETHWTHWPANEEDI